MERYKKQYGDIDLANRLQTNDENVKEELNALHTDVYGGDAMGLMQEEMSKLLEELERAKNKNDNLEDDIMLKNKEIENLKTKFNRASYAAEQMAEVANKMGDPEDWTV